MSSSKAQALPFPDDTDSLLALFFLAWRGFAAEPDAILEKEGLGRVHHRILYTVVRIPDIRVGVLADTLGVTRQAIHGPLSALIERGLVASRVSKESARERALSVTEHGRRLEDRASGAQRRELERVFTSVGPDAATGWARVMHGLAAAQIARAPGLVTDAIDDAVSERSKR